MTSTRFRTPLARLAAPFALAAACATGRGGSMAERSPTVVIDTNVIQVVVRSNYVGPLDLYLVSEGLPTRLGDVTGPGPERFVIDPNQVDVNDLRVVAVPVGGYGRASTGRLTVRKGNVVEFNIAPVLRQSSVLIR